METFAYVMVMLCCTVLSYAFIAEVCRDYLTTNKFNAHWNQRMEEYLLPADDSHLKAPTIRFLEPTFEDIEACVLDTLERMSKSNNLFTAYINGDYTPPKLPELQIDVVEPKLPLDIGWDEMFSISSFNRYAQ